MTQHAGGLHLLVAVGAQLVPTLQIHSLVAGDILRWRLQRPMRRGMGKIKEERLGTIALTGHLDRLVGDRVGEIEIVGGDLDLGIVLDQVMRREIIATAVDDPEESVEATLTRRRMLKIPDGPVFGVTGNEIASDMPFTGHDGAVPGQPQGLGDGHGVVTQEALISGHPEIGRHMPDPSLVRVQAG